MGHRLSIGNKCVTIFWVAVFDEQSFIICCNCYTSSAQLLQSVMILMVLPCVVCILASMKLDWDNIPAASDRHLHQVLPQMCASTLKPAAARNIPYLFRFTLCYCCLQPLRITPSFIYLALILKLNIDNPCCSPL